MNILESLKDKLLVADGAFGTCYVGMYGEQGTVAPELANMRHPERVLEIHKEYVKAGAGLIRTNTLRQIQRALMLTRIMSFQMCVRR